MHEDHNVLRLRYAIGNYFKLNYYDYLLHYCDYLIFWKKNVL